MANASLSTALLMMRRSATPPRMTDLGGLRLRFWFAQDDSFVVDKRTADRNNDYGASGHGDEGGHGFDPVPEIFETKVFVGGVLVVVVIGDGYGDGASVGGALHCIERDGAAEGRKEDDLAASALNSTDDIGGDGEVDGRAGGGFAMVGLDVGYLCVSK